MAPWFPFPLTGVPKPTLTDVIDIFLVAFLIYQFLLIIRGRRAAHVLVGLCILAGIYAVAMWAKLEVLRTILATLAPKGYKQISRAHVIDPVESARGRKVVWSHPAFAIQSVFIRNDNEIIRVDMAAKKRTP